GGGGEGLLKRGNSRGRKGDWAQPKGSQRGKIAGTCRHIATHAHFLFPPAHLGNNLLQKLEKAGMPHIDQSRYAGIAAVCSEKILSKIIGSDAEEINFRAKLIQHESH